MHFCDVPKDDLLILKELSGEYLAKQRGIFYFIYFSLFRLQRSGVAECQNYLKAKVQAERFRLSRSSSLLSVYKLSMRRKREIIGKLGKTGTRE